MGSASSRLPRSDAASEHRPWPNGRSAYSLAMSWKCVMDEGIESTDRHAQRPDQLDEGTPDAAEPDDAERLAGKLRPKALGFVPVAIAHALVEPRNRPRHSEHQSERVLGH